MSINEADLPQRRRYSGQVLSQAGGGAAPATTQPGEINEDELPTDDRSYNVTVAFPDSAISRPTGGGSTSIVTGRPGEQGEQGEIGPPGPKGEKGEPGQSAGADSTYVHVQSLPASVWTITHSLGFWPNITTVDSAGEQVEGEVDYVSSTAVRVTFSAAFSGLAYLS